MKAQIARDTDDRAADTERPSAGINLSNLAYRAVSQMIRDKRLAGGEQIVETRLAETLGVSRTPLREALQRLEGEGLVRKTANRSFMVRSVDLAEYLHSLRMREIVEAEAAAQAVGHIPQELMAAVRHEIETLRASPTYHVDAHWRSDDNLHNLFIDHCGNPVMTGVVRSLRVTTHLFEIAKLKDRLKPDSLEHLAILSALEAGDRAGARKAVQTHMRSLKAFALAAVS